MGFGPSVEFWKMIDLEALKEKAMQAKKALLDGNSSRPFFIEFSGSPKSGKSTCIDVVGHFFRRLNYRILAPTEGASKRTPYFLKDDWVAFNAWSACYALSHVIEGLYHSDKHDIAILDRGLFDALVWFELLASMDKISLEDRNHIQNFLLVEKWRSVIDMVFLFKSDPETSMEQENRYTLILEPGRAMNLEFLGSLNEAYDTVREKYSNNFQNVIVIDTSENKKTSPDSTAYEVVDQILDGIAKLQKGVNDGE